MVNAAASAAGFVDLLAGVIALEIFFLLDPQSAGAGTTTPSPRAPLLDSAAAALGLLVPLGAAGALFTAAAVIYRRHMGHAAVPVTGAAAAIRRLRLSEVVVFIMCVAAGVLDFFFFVRPAGGAKDHGAQAARALGMAAHRALPAASTAAFFWGMMLIIIAHVRAGGEGGGGAIAGAGRGANQEGAVRLLTNVAVGAAAGLFFLVTTAFCVRCRS
nr:unnamed protein product [Digitaria exilis]